MNGESRFEEFAGMAILLLLVIGCFVVLRPFGSALLLALILSYSTWSIYAWGEQLLSAPAAVASLRIPSKAAAAEKISKDRGVNERS